MSVQARPKRLSVTQIQSRKGGDKIVCRRMGPGLRRDLLFGRQAAFSLK